MICPNREVFLPVTTGPHPSRERHKRPEGAGGKYTHDLAGRRQKIIDLATLRIPTKSHAAVG